MIGPPILDTAKLPDRTEKPEEMNFLHETGLKRGKSIIFHLE